MILTFSGRSAPSALKIADEDIGIRLNRGSRGDVNWGRARANTSLNPDISNVTNKRLMRRLFAEHDVPMPELVSWSDVSSDLTRGIPRKVIGRPDSHMKGRGFWLIQRPGDMVKAMRGTRRKKAATHFMEYIDAPREYRVHIFRGKSIRISEKVFDEARDYTTGKPQHEVKHVRRGAKQALEAVGLDFGAVDILASNTKCWVLEVNAAPGLGGSMPKLYAETFKRYMNNERLADE